MRVLSNAENKGKAYSLNRGIEAASGDFIACLDADSVVEGGIIKKMVGYFEDGEIAAVTPALGVHRTANFLEKIQYVEYLLNMFLRKTLSFLDSIHVTPGVFTIYRKDVLNEVGGFDEDNLTEDMEIALKIHKAGYKIENNMNAKSFTYCPDNWRGLLNQRIRWYRGAIQNSLKYKYMFFNPKYGNLGMFLLPFNFISVLSIILIFFIMAWNYTVNIADFVWKLYLIDFDVLSFIGNINLEFFLMNAFSSPIMLSIVGLALGAYVLYISFSVNNVDIKSRKPQYFVYLLAFPLALMLLWLLAFVHEVFGFKRKW